MNKNIFNSLVNNFDHIIRKKTYIPYTPKMKNNSKIKMREMNNELNLFYTGMNIREIREIREIRDEKYLKNEFSDSRYLN